MSKTQSIVTGEYNRHGYAVNLDGVEFYRAGNSPHESTTVVALEHALPLRTLREYCRNTSREIATEQKAKFGGITRISDQ